MRKICMIMFVLFCSSLHAKMNMNNGSSIQVGDGATLEVINTLDVANGGSLIKVGSGAIEGGDVVFDGGKFVENGVETEISGLFDPDTGNVVLNGDKTVTLASGSLIAGVTVSGTGNVLQGVGLPGNSVTLADQNTALSVGLQSELDQNIVLNGGSVTLLEDLVFTNGSFVSGNGVVSGDGRQLTASSQAFSSAQVLTYDDNTHVALRAPLTLASGGLWTFKDNTSFNGNGTSSDLKDGGIAVGTGATLALSSMHLANVVPTSLQYGDTSSQMNLSDVTLSLSGSITMTKGKWYVEGDTTLMLGGSELRLTSDSHLTVDGATVWYASDTNFDFYLQNVNNITLINDGAIKSLNAAGVAANPLVLTQDTQFSTHYDVDNARQWSYDFSINNTIDADFTGHTVRFANITSQMLKVGEIGVAGDATISNVVLEAFSPQTVTVATGSTLTFAGGTRVELAKNEQATIDLVFAGSAVLDGKNHELDLAQKAIKVASGGTLTLKNITITGVTGTNISCDDDTASIIYENVTLVQSGNASFAKGSFQVTKHLTLQGKYTYSYTSDQVSTIAANARMVVGEDETLFYAPTSGGSDKLVCAATTSHLSFLDATLKVHEEGLSLGAGRINFDGESFIDSLATASSGAMHINGAVVTVRRGAHLSLRSGHVKYTSGTLSFGSKDARFTVDPSTTLTVADDTSLVITGTLEKKTGGVLKHGNGASRITWDDACFINEGIAAQLTCDYSPGTSTFLLEGNERAHLSAGIHVAGITISGSGNTVLGQPNIESDIVLADANAAVTLGLQSELDHNVVLNSGSLMLSEDLVFADGNFVSGSGSVNTNKRALVTGREKLTASSPLTFASTSNVVCNGPVALTDTWTCVGAVSIQGNNNVFDVSQGALSLANASDVLTLVDVQMPQVMQSSLVFGHADAKLKLSGSKLQFAQDVSIAGVVEVVGDTVFVLDEHSLTFANGSKLIVDAATLWYDSKGVDFYTENKDLIELKNGGSIKQVGSDSAGLTVSSALHLVNDYHVDASNKFVATFSANDASYTIDAGGHALTFAHAASEMMVVGDEYTGTKLTLENMVIQNFAPRYVTVKTGSSLIYGDGTRLVMSKDEGGTFVMTTNDAVVLDGKGYCLDMANGVITVAAGSTLTLKNVHLQNMATGKIVLSDATSKVIFENVVFEQSGTFVWSQGSYEVSKQLTLLGGHTFSYTSDQISTIRANSTLYAERESTLTYAPASKGKDKWAFAAATSQLALHDATLTVQDKGMTVATGRIAVDGQSSVTSSATLAADACNLTTGVMHIKRGAELTLTAGFMQCAANSLTFGSQDARVSIASGAKLVVADDASLSVAGTLEQVAAGGIVGGNSASRVSFEKGIFVNQGIAANLTCDYNPTTSTILLEGNERAVLDAGVHVAGISISGSGNTVLGQPNIESDITLADADAAVTLGLQSELDHNVVLNGGALTLSEDLVFADGNFVSGSGTVNTNKRALVTGREKLTASSPLTFASTSNVVCNGPVALTDTWTCVGAVSVQGNNNVFDVSQGALSLANASDVLTLVDVQMPQVMQISLVFGHADAKLKLSGGKLQFAQDVSIAGVVEVVGDTIFVLDENSLTFANGSKLIVDAATLWYDSKGVDFYTENKDRIELKNGGSIKQVGSDSAGLTVSSALHLVNDYHVDASNKFVATFSANDASYTIDAGGHALTFAHAASEMVVVGDEYTGTKLTLENMVIQNFAPRYVTVNANSSLIYGDGTRLVMSKDEGGTFAMTTNDAVVLDGKGYCLDMGNGVITVAAGSTLTLKNVHLQNMATGKIVLSDATSKVIFENVVFEQSGTFVWSQGSYEVSKQLTLLGGHTFSYTSDQISTIRANSTLYAERESTLAYAPASKGKDKWAFAAATSQLSLHDATLTVQDKGMTVATGRIAVDGKSSMTSSATLAADACNLTTGVMHIKRGAELSLTSGFMKCAAGSLTFGSQDARAVIASGAKLVVADDASLSIGGTLEQVAAGGIVGGNSASRVSFEKGIFVNQGIAAQLTCDYNPTTSTILLEGNERAVLDAGVHVAGITISGSGNTVLGQPNIESDIVLADADAAVTLGLQSELDHNVVLNGGSLTLSEDLVFADGNFVIGSGSVDTNKRAVITGRQEIAAQDDITLKTSSHISLEGPLTLTATWSCIGAVSVGGSSNIFDVSQGVLSLANASDVLTLVDVQMPQVMQSSLVFGHADAKLKLSGSKLQFAQDVSIAGVVEVVGDTVFVLDEHNLTFANGSKLIVDTATLWYDSKGVDFYTENKDRIELKNGGSIKQVGSDSAGLTASSALHLVNDYHVDASNKFVATFSANDASYTIDAGGHALTFAHAASEMMVVGDEYTGTKLTLENMVIQNFAPRYVTVNANSSLIYGDGTRLVLSKDEGGSFAMTTNDAVVLDGKGYCLDMANGVVTVAAGSTLTLKNVHLQNMATGKIVLSDATSKVIFENVVFEQSGTFVWSQGSYEVSKQLTLLGGHTFSYTSDQVSTIRANSTLYAERESTLTYAPASKGKDKWAFAAATSQLSLHDATLTVQDKGMTVATGRIEIDGQSSVSSSATLAADACNLTTGAMHIKRGAELSLTAGFMKCAANSLTFGSQDARVSVASGAKLVVADDASLSVAGTLEQVAAGGIVGGNSASRVSFEKGIFVNQGIAAQLTCDYNPTTSTILLEGNERAVLDAGVHVAGITISGSGNTVLGQPNIESDIVLADANAAVTLGLQSELDHNVILNGGTLILSEDLVFADGNFVSGSGSVNTNKRAVITGREKLTASSPLTFASTSNVVCNGPVALTDTWTCAGAVSVQGNNNVFDVSQGALSLANASDVLTLVDVHMPQIAQSSLVFGHADAKLKLSGSKLQLAQDVSIAGVVEVVGDTVLHLDVHSLTFASGSKLIVDAATLWYDSKGVDFYTENKDRIELKNGGSIKQVGSGGENAGFSMSQSLNMVNDYTFDANNKFTVAFAQDNDSYTLSGGGHALHFAHTSLPMASIGAGEHTGTLFLTDVVMTNFAPAYLTVEAGSSLVYADKTRLVLGKDEGGTFAMTTNDAVVLDGKGYCLDMANGVITVAAGSTLTLKNVHLQNMATGALVLSDATSKVIFENVVFEQSGTFVWSQGSYEVSKQLTLLGGHTFSYTSDQVSTIRANSMLYAERESTLTYAPASKGKDKWAFAAATAQLSLHDATLTVQDKGMTVATGRIAVDGQSSISSGATLAADALQVTTGVIHIKRGAELTLTTGFMKCSAQALSCGSQDARAVIASGAKLVVADDVSLSIAGTLEQVAAGGIVGGNSASRVSFVKGIFVNQGAESHLSCDYNPTTNTILLEGNERAMLDAGVHVAGITISGSGNTVLGQPNIESDIVLADADAAVTLGLQSELDHNVVLNGGLLTLSEDLVFADGNFLSGSGSVNTNKRALITGREKLTASSPLTFASTSNVVCNGPVALTDTWTCAGAVSVQGNNNVFDTSQGTLSLANASDVLTLVDVQMPKCVQTSFVCGSSLSKVRMSGVKMQAREDITFAGTLEIVGDSVMHLGEHTYTISAANGLVVDGCILWYDSAGFDFYTHNKDNIVLKNGGRIRQVGSDSSGLAVSSALHLVNDYHVNGSNPFVATFSANNEAYAIDAGGHALMFAHAASEMMVVGDEHTATKLTLKNMVIQNFAPRYVTVKSGSSLIYGDGTRLVLSKDEGGTFAMTTKDAVVLDGKGYCLDMGSGVVTVGSGSTLILKNLHLENMATGAIVLSDATSKVIFENVLCEQSGSCVWSKGSFEVSKQLTLLGGHTFSYTSDQVSTIRANSTLHAERGSTVVYAPAGKGKEKLVCAASTAQLSLHDATLTVQDKGMTVATGRIEVDGQSSISSSATSVGDALELTTGVVHIKRGAELRLTSGFMQGTENTIRFGSRDASLHVESGAHFVAAPGAYVVVDGTLEQDVVGGIAGGNAQSRIRFKNGVFVQGGVAAHLTCDYDPTTQTILLEGNEQAAAQPGVFVSKLRASGTGNQITGQPNFNDTIVIADGSSSLSMGITTALDKAIALNGGTLLLQDDLHLRGTTFFHGPGVIDGAQYRVYTGADKLIAQTPLVWQGGTHLVLHGNLELQNAWTWKGDGYLNSDGHTIDAEHSSAQIVLDDTVTGNLSIANAYIQGIGNKTFNLASDEAKLTFANTTLEFDQSVTVTTGTWYIDGDVSLVLHDKRLMFAGDAEIVINPGARLAYSSEFNFASDNEATLTIHPGGSIVTASSGGGGAGSSGSASSLLYNKSKSILVNVSIDVYNPMNITGTGVIDLNFTGHEVSFRQAATDELVIIPDQTDVQLEHARVVNLNPASVTLGAGSSFTFGTGSYVELGRDETLQDAIDYVFAGETTLDGDGHALDLANKSLIVKEGGHLTIKNIRLKGVHGANLRCLASNSSVTFEDVVIEMDDDFVFAQGSFAVRKDVLLLGRKLFTYTSDQASNILSQSSLTLARDCSLVYAPAGGGKTGFVFEDKSSQLVLREGTFVVAATGAVLTKGTVIADPIGTLESLATQLSGACVFGDGVDADNNVCIRIARGGELIIGKGYIDIRDAVAT